MKNLSKRQTVFFAAVVVMVFLVIWVIWGNSALEVNEYEIVSDRIPQSFDGFRIAQVSDLHNAQFGSGNSRLIAALSQTEPDIIVLTGDLIDSGKTDIDIALAFARQAVKISPVYYITGNHEAWVPEYEELKIGLIEAGVTVLDNQKVQFTREGESITLMGIADPSF